MIRSILRSVQTLGILSAVLPGAFVPALILGTVSGMWSTDETITAGTWFLSHVPFIGLTAFCGAMLAGSASCFLRAIGE